MGDPWTATTSPRRARRADNRRRGFGRWGGCRLQLCLAGAADSALRWSQRRSGDGVVVVVDGGVGVAVPGELFQVPAKMQGALSSSCREEGRCRPLWSTVAAVTHRRISSSDTCRPTACLTSAVMRATLSPCWSTAWREGGARRGEPYQSLIARRYASQLLKQITVAFSSQNNGAQLSTTRMLARPCAPASMRAESFPTSPAASHPQRIARRLTAYPTVRAAPCHKDASCPYGHPSPPHGTPKPSRSLCHETARRRREVREAES